MNMHLKYKVLMALVSGLATVTAVADVIIDGQNIPGTDIQSISIDPTSGDISIATIAPGYTVSKNVEGDNVVISSFTATPSSITAGQSTTIAWVTSNAVSCAATNGTGTWAGSTIALPNGNAEFTITEMGDYTFTLTCDGATAGDQVTRNVVVSVNSANAVAITSLTATPNTIDEGGSTTISWATSNAASCTPSGGAGGWAESAISLPSGSDSFTIASAGNYQFTLTCDGIDGDQVARSVAVTVNGVTAECGTPALSGIIDDWTEFWLVDFPGPRYDNKFATISRFGYYALSFDTANINDDGKLSTIETTQTIGVRTGAISQCPGDFNVPAECRYTWGISGGIRWATNGRSGACQLEPNTTYYFNVTYTDGEDSSASTCTESPCITILQASNR